MSETQDQKVQPSQTPVHKAAKSNDPTRSSRSLAIALIVSVILLLSAIGIVVWIAVSSRSPGQSATRAADPNDTRDVKVVSFVVPATLPSNYVKNDQSTLEATNTYYYDDATNCGLTVGVTPIPSGKSIKDVITEAATAVSAKGVNTTSNAQGDSYGFKDANGKATYTFDSVNLEQDVKVDGVAFTKQNSTVAFKQFGSQAASLSFTCKAETWASKSVELAGLIKQFIVKTER